MGSVRAIDICTCSDERGIHTLVQESAESSSYTHGPCRRAGCGCPGFIPHPQPGHVEDRLAEDSEVIVAAAAALAKAEGRSDWSTENLPGNDVYRARLMLIAVDMLLAVRRVR